MVEIITKEAAESTRPQEKKDDTKKKRVAIPQIWSVLNKARRTFDAQLIKNNDAKLECVKRFSRAANNDPQKFHGTYMEQVGRLIDSKRFCKDAEALGCDPTILATHVVFMGSAMINRVLKQGIANTNVAKDIELFKEPFLPDPQSFAK